MEHSCDMSAWFQRLVYVAHDHNGDSGRDAATAAVADGLCHQDSADHHNASLHLSRKRCRGRKRRRMRRKWTLPRPLAFTERLD